MTAQLPFAQLVVLRYATCDLSPYRDVHGLLPPGWPNWQEPIDEASDKAGCLAQGWITAGWLHRADLTPSGRQVLTEAGFPQTTTFPEFWDWFVAHEESTL